MFILPNLLCEYEMAGRNGGLPKAARSIESRWNAVLRLISGWENASIVMPGEPLPDDPILPWCDLWGLQGTPRSIVEDANDKRTSHRIEAELEIGLSGARLVASVEDFENAARAVARRWVVKDPWGVAGRERLLGDGSPTVNQTNWCRGRLSQGLELIFEPWVEERREWSIHFDTCGGDEADGGDGGEDVVFVGSCALLTHRDGTFRGIRPGDEAPPELVSGATAAARKIAALGYRGPIGIDSMIGTVDGARAVRPVTEINARYSFGRLGLELARRTNVSCFEWRHDRVARDALHRWEDMAGGKPCRLPDFCDPDAASGSWCQAKPTFGISG